MNEQVDIETWNDSKLINLHIHSYMYTKFNHDCTLIISISYCHDHKHFEVVYENTHMYTMVHKLTTVNHTIIIA